MGNQNTKNKNKYQVNNDIHDNSSEKKGLKSHNFDQTECKQIRNDSNFNKQYDKTIAIIIPLDEGYWEKRYSTKDSISLIEVDFRKENCISEKTKVSFIYKNKILKMDKNIIINSLIDDENTKEIIIYHQINDNETIIESSSNYFGKPFFSPFQIVIFSKKHKNFKTKKFDESIINAKSLNKCNATSAYCNGDNHLYISGGVDSENIKIGIFWKINLENCEVEDVNYEMPESKNHSMIQIEDKVYIVGGQDEKTYFYNTKDNKISFFANLNFTRVEPSLIKYQNYLYCFDSMKDQYYKFSIERINLKVNEEKWVLLLPNISPSLNPEDVFSQKFFGVTIEKQGGSILFLGGNLDNYNSNQKDIKNLKYNINDNIIEKSDVPYKEFSLKEKTFKSFNHKVDFILPDFDQMHQKIVFYLKERKQVEIVNYRHKTKYGNDDFNKGYNSTNLFNVDFNMPGITSQNQREKEPGKNMAKSYFPSSNRKDDLGKISIRVMQPDEKVNINDQLSSARTNKNVLVDTENKSKDKNSDTLIKIESQKIDSKAEYKDVDTILDIKAPENDEKGIIVDSGRIKKEENKENEKEEEKEEKKEKEDDKNKIKKNKSFIYELLISTFNKFHSCRDDPCNNLNKKTINNLSKSIEIPNNFPTRKEIKKLSHQFYT